MGNWSDDEKRREHEREVAYNLGRAQGRADERADVVAWLRKRDREYVVADYCAGDIKRGEHVDAAKGKP